MLGNAAPDFSDPVGLIEACHGRIATQCELLRKMIAYQQEHGADAEMADAAKRVLRYFDVAAPLHHADEEQDLFPALQDIPELQPLIQRLQDEHAEHHALWLTLREDLLRIADGDTAEQLESNSEPFIHAYLQHAEIENTQILPRAREVLESETLARIGKAMQQRRQG